MGHVPGSICIFLRYRISSTMPPTRQATMNTKYPVIRNPDTAAMTAPKSNDSIRPTPWTNQEFSKAPLAPFVSSTAMAPPKKLKIMWKAMV